MEPLLHSLKKGTVVIDAHYLCIIHTHTHTPNTIKCLLLMQTLIAVTALPEDSLNIDPQTCNTPLSLGLIYVSSSCVMQEVMKLKRC